MVEQDTSKACRDTVLSILEGTGQAKVNVKELRKQVLITLQLDDADKPAKKAFKQAMKDLEETGDVSLDSEGLVTLKNKGKKRKSKKEKKDKSKKRKSETVEQPVVEVESDQGDEDATDAPKAASEAEEGDPHKGEADNPDKNRPCKGNPQGVTRIFLGNLPFAVDETSLSSFLKDKVTHIKWITDKETGKFYGSAFVEMQDSEAAAVAVSLAGESLMGRPVKINFAPARAGDPWPPEKKVIKGSEPTKSGEGRRSAGGTGTKALGEKPENCVKLFIGNLSYDIDDEAITKFFANVGAEVKAVRWLHHKESGDFKGCGFVEFWNTEACEKGATLNGKNLLERPIRIDWTD